MKWCILKNIYIWQNKSVTGNINVYFPHINMFSPSYSSPLCRCRPPSSLLPVGKHPPRSAKGQRTPAWSNHVQRPHCRRQRSLLARGPEDRGEDPEADPREPAPGGEVAPRRAARSGAEPPGRTPPRWPGSWRRCTSTRATCRGWCCPTERWTPSRRRRTDRRFRTPGLQLHPSGRHPLDLPRPPPRGVRAGCARGSSWSWGWGGRAGGSTGWSAARATRRTPSLSSAAGSADEASWARTCGSPTGSDIWWSGRGQTVKNLTMSPTLEKVHWNTEMWYCKRRNNDDGLFFFSFFMS